jgi:hypothetical protein
MHLAAVHGSDFGPSLHSKMHCRLQLLFGFCILDTIGKRGLLVQ